MIRRDHLIYKRQIAISVIHHNHKARNINNFILGKKGFLKRKEEKKAEMLYFLGSVFLSGGPGKSACLKMKLFEVGNGIGNGNDNDSGKLKGSSQTLQWRIFELLLKPPSHALTIGRV